MQIHTRPTVLLDSIAGFPRFISFSLWHILKYSDRILLLRNSSIMFDGNYNALVSNINLNKEGLKYPFEIEMSNFKYIQKIKDFRKHN